MSDLERRAGQAIEEQRQALAEEIVARQYRLQERLWQPFGAVGREKSVRDAGYHLAYLAEALAAAQPALFVDYVRWAQALFAGLGLAETALPTTLRVTGEVLQEALPVELAQAAASYLEAGANALQDAIAAPRSYIEEGAPLSELAIDYIAAVLRGDRRAASQMILDAVEAGASIKSIYLDVFQRTQHEIGRLWQTNRISVAQEHLATATTQMIMSQLYPRIFGAERNGRVMVATCVGDELHEIGVRMVADFFEMAGWDTFYLGANTPAGSVIQTIAERHADLLAISATITYHVSAVAELIGQVRQAPEASGVVLMVGGYPFNVAPQLWRSVGADGYAHDAAEAVEVGERLARGTH